MAKIRLEKINYVYSPGTPFETRALRDVDLEIKEGIVTGIIGHTGSGKSTMVMLLNGLEKPTSGRVLLDGVDIWEKPKEISKVRFRVGLVMQYPEYQLFEETVAKDIAFGPRNMGLSEEEIAARVREAAGIVGLAPELLEKSPFELSGGEKRRAAIAGIIAMKPEVLVLDEPAAGLDPAGRERILATIRKYREQTGGTVIIVSHSMEDMAEICDEIVVMLEGSIFMSGSTAEVFSKAGELRRIGLDVPEITGLMLKLRDMGVEIDTIPYTVSDAVPKLMKLLK
ncbi:MAG: energy-coupling factor transporter ATPase [Clostridiales bacterium]|nr:energy-coupling factor transporter ATPase [Clostridiales bacterium]HOA84508.1 energy-coupling factor transporter ATPase [Bacillota bacterium]